MDTGGALSCEEIARLQLFGELPRDALEAIASRCKVRRFAPGEHVLHLHDSSTDLFFVLDGRVRVLLYSPYGRDVSFRDLNAGEAETPSRILQARPEDSGNPALAGRALEALELRLPEAERFTVIHGGRRRMLDHILCSPALAARCRRIEANNRGLPDEVEMATNDPRSNHAPLVAAFDL